MQSFKDIESIYVHILALVKTRRANICTQNEIATDLKVSRRKYIDFENGKIKDVDILNQCIHYLMIDLKITI